MSDRARFPSLTLSAAGHRAEGSFAQAQADFLEPDPDAVARLRGLLEEKNAAVVAHFYMDAELQGILYACESDRIHVSDSLWMADKGVEKAEAGATNVVVLGVDFMSENVRAVMDAAGHPEVGVYRVATEEIGCSLAESAETRAYAAWLEQASQQPKSLHVVYINTSLRTKAHAHHKVPTITCTSSNVVKTILQATAQEPETHIWFGPDTYMGENLRAMFSAYAELGDETIRKLHPEHDTATLKRLLDQFHVFGQGNCVVHHMFGADVATRVREEYPSAYVTAHLEVPGEMFELALAAQRKGRGVVGSTSNILGFIKDTVAGAVAEGREETLKFILGTEAGMASAIVRGLAEDLRKAPSNLLVEIIFPVASEAVAVDETNDVLPILPGVKGGEGCTVAGGCATCPYMKMNSYDALIDVLEALGGEEDLVGYEPRRYDETLDGKTVAELGGEPILHMRAMQRDGRLPDALIEDVRSR